ncbi:hypothetical protein [Nonomuraea rhodomycinica]|uniref:Uncharacterized protein n=1 Tax=Nonomuraea rhodomycinica TaxID=1712872 RepID=A0A7Y6IIF8_9ACTN|nr:hypothetical protein [Nonomuraea rhodomycinica]NUW38857.1 hypothetical protein [Nonomuraea rhodomycinica]
MIPRKELLSGIPLSTAQIGVLLSLVHPPGLAAQNVTSGWPTTATKKKTRARKAGAGQT